MRKTFLALACLAASQPVLARDFILDRSGEVVLEHSPFCEAFVVRTGDAFALLRWTGGLLVFAEGDRIVGPLDRPGEAIVTIVGHGDMRAAILPLTADADEARAFFFSRCEKTFEPRAPQGLAAR